MPVYELAALAAALAWAVGGLIAAYPARYLGTIAFNRWRMSLTFIMLVGVVSFNGGWADIPAHVLLPAFLSGLIGIFIGDALLFATFNRLGARRSAILFSMNAPLTVILGWLFLEEALPFLTLIGAVISLCGVVIAILYGKRRDQISTWETITPPLWVGVAFGLGAALCQAVGILLARPIQEAGLDPFVMSMLRVGTAALCLNVMWGVLPKISAPLNPVTLRIGALTALNGFLGMLVGMTLVLFALSGGEAGIVAVLSATSPVLMLPLLWLVTREAPAIGAWVGAGLVVIGTGLIFA